jgi:hypothetical protein
MHTKQEILEGYSLSTFITLFNKINSLQMYDSAQNYTVLTILQKVFQ